MRCILCLLLIVPPLLSACSSAPVANADAEPARYDFAQDDYPAVFDVAVEVLRDYGFRPARRDFRFGTITTFSKESPTLFEFWIDDATTRDQRLADTLNAQERKVTLRVTQPEDGPVYTLTAQVMVQRVQRPARYLTHSARGALSAQYADTPTHLRERGIDGDQALPLTRDPYLEARLIEAIRQRVQSQ